MAKSYLASSSRCYLGGVNRICRMDLPVDNIRKQAAFGKRRRIFERFYRALHYPDYLSFSIDERNTNRLRTCSHSAQFLFLQKAFLKVIQINVSRAGLNGRESPTFNTTVDWCHNCCLSSGIGIQWLLFNSSFTMFIGFEMLGCKERNPTYAAVVGFWRGAREHGGLRR